MIEERAVILSLQSEFSNAESTTQSINQSIATLEIERRTACGLCGKTRGCGNSIWGKLFAHDSSAFKAQNRINAKVGDSVIVGINESALLKSAVLLYIVPLVTLFIGSILASYFKQTDGSTILGAVVGLLIGLMWVKGHTASSRYFKLQQPEILRLANSQDNAIKFS